VIKRAKEIITEYWEILIAGIMLLIGVVIGTSGNREKVLKEDLKARESASKKIRQGTEAAIKKNQNAIEKAEKEKEAKEEEADSKKHRRKKELLKDPDKLDKILKEKYDLEGE
jgi:hypothetical protein